MKTSGHLRQDGFALIEALIAVVVLATGLLALTALQGSLIKSSADAKARSQVAAFAQSVLDTRRVSGFPGPGNNLQLSTTAQRTAAAQAMGASSISESTNIRTFVASVAGAFPTTGCATSACVTTALGGRADAAQYKQVDMTLSWTDATGTGRALRLTTAVSPLALNNSDVLVDRPPPDQSGLRPIVRRPTPVTEGMIPIALGDGQDTAATNPKPELIGRTNGTLVADTRFEVLTYNGSDNLGDTSIARFNKRIETAVVGCTCQFGDGGFPSSGPDADTATFLKGSTFRPAYWDGERYKSPVRTGIAANTSPANVAQSQLCDVCCRDHKDPSAVGAPHYKPWLASGIAHDHYNPDSSGVLQNVTTGQYVESCRVIRVDGVWRVTPDPRLEDIALIPTRNYTTPQTAPVTSVVDSGEALSPLIAGAGKTNYVTYMYDFIKQMFYDNSSSLDRPTMQTTAGLNQPLYVPINVAPDKRWLHARGVLVDKLETDAQDRIQRAIDACPSTATSALQKAQCILPYIPMATINITELARWSGQLASYVVGAPALPAWYTASNSINYGQARMRRSPSAVALYPPVAPDDDVDPLYDEQVVALMNAIKTGTWLSVTSTNGSIFGDPTNPTRGRLSVAGDVQFDVNWNGVAATTNSVKTDDPLLGIVADQTNLSSEVGCNASTARNTSNPYGPCTSATASNVMLAISQFNLKVQPTQTQNSNPCNSANNAPKVPKQATCLAYALTKVNVDGTDYTPTAVNYTLQAGTLGKTSEKRTLIVPGPLQTPSPAKSVITMYFSSSSSNALQVCNGTQFVEWTCN